ncbi:hypothetical protein JTE90_023664 [Oedothorax gibbosus]|uniref:EF-hand domain-containing protein n=1 Tax=Oedothorax gibbosus TaxID=931172 RepID=A0AAV6V152_9ARAC|nr:hypothetical protein JTE90_023664 [Oedothorax gibbosus]
MHVFVSLCLTVLLFEEISGQFFTKTTNSIPRMGRSDKSLPNLVRRVARTLFLVIKMVGEYDQDGNGELNPEELMDIPFIQSAIRKSFEGKEMKGQYPFQDCSIHISKAY